MDRGKVIVVGVGIGLTPLQLHQIKQACEKAQLEMVNAAEAMERIAIVSPYTKISVKELIEVAKMAPYPFTKPMEHTNKQTKEQHKRAMRYHGRR